MLQGKAHVYGDNIDTDVIIPARYLMTTDPAELARHCMEDIDTEFITRVEPGDFILGGRNFGSGSSREHAPIAIKAAGVSCVIADSFARIFFRNAVNIGLPILICTGAAGASRTGDLLQVDLDSGEVHNRTRQAIFAATPLPSFMQAIISAGGLMPWIAATRTRAEGSGPVTAGLATNEPVQADFRLD